MGELQGPSFLPDRRTPSCRNGPQDALRRLGAPRKPPGSVPLRAHRPPLRRCLPFVPEAAPEAASVSEGDRAPGIGAVRSCGREQPDDPPGGRVPAAFPPLRILPVPARTLRADGGRGRGSAERSGGAPVLYRLSRSDRGLPRLPPRRRPAGGNDSGAGSGVPGGSDAPVSDGPRGDALGAPAGGSTAGRRRRAGPDHDQRGGAGRVVGTPGIGGITPGDSPGPPAKPSALRFPRRKAVFADHRACRQRIFPSLHEVVSSEPRDPDSTAQGRS